jgi:ankyrin repeat protein
LTTASPIMMAYMSSSSPRAPASVQDLQSFDTQALHAWVASLIGDPAAAARLQQEGFDGFGLSYLLCPRGELRDDTIEILVSRLGWRMGTAARLAAALKFGTPAGAVPSSNPSSSTSTNPFAMGVAPSASTANFGSAPLSAGTLEKYGSAPSSMTTFAGGQSLYLPMPASSGMAGAPAPANFATFFEGVTVKTDTSKAATPYSTPPVPAHYASSVTRGASSPAPASSSGPDTLSVRRESFDAGKSGSGKAGKKAEKVSLISDRSEGSNSNTHVHTPGHHCCNPTVAPYSAPVQHFACNTPQASSSTGSLHTVARTSERGAPGPSAFSPRSNLETEERRSSAVSSPASPRSHSSSAFGSSPVTSPRGGYVALNDNNLPMPASCPPQRKASLGNAGNLSPLTSPRARDPMPSSPLAVSPPVSPRGDEPVVSRTSNGGAGKFTPLTGTRDELSNSAYTPTLGTSAANPADASAGGAGSSLTEHPAHGMPLRSAPALARSLLDAARRGVAAEVQGMLNAGAPIEAVNKSGHTALHIACDHEGHEHLVRLLIERGAEVNARGKDGHTPLHWAARNGNDAVVKLLLASAAIHVSAPDKERSTPLHVACFYGNAGAVQTLLQAGASVHARTLEGWTPLHVAADRGYVSVARMLLEYGAPTDALTRGGKSPIQKAKHYPLMRELLLGVRSDA